MVLIVNIETLIVTNVCMDGLLETVCHWGFSLGYYYYYYNYINSNYPRTPESDSLEYD